MTDPVTLRIGLTPEELVRVAQGQEVTFGALPGGLMTITVALRGGPVPAGAPVSATPPPSTLGPSVPPRVRTEEEEQAALRLAEENLEAMRAELGYTATDPAAHHAG